LIKSKSGVSRFSSYYVRTGDSATARIAHVVKKKTFLWIVLDLAWTAGPITLLALYLGNIGGLGTEPSPSRIVYFMIYTLVMGGSAIIVTILRNAFYNPKIEMQQKRLLDVIDKTHLFTLHARNCYLKNFQPDERKIAAAFYILQSAGSSMESLKLAAWDLSQDPAIVELVERNITLSSQGMISLIQEGLDTHHEKILRLREKIQPTAPATFALFEKVIQGNPPRVQEGREREDGFIQRVLDAATHSDINLMTLSDAYESMSVVFELLNGRKVETLDVKFSGTKELEKYKKCLDHAHRNYRMVLRERNSALRFALEELYRFDALDDLVELPDNQELQVSYLKKGIYRLDPEQKLSLFHSYQTLFNIQQKAIHFQNKLMEAEHDYSEKWKASGEKFTVALQEQDLENSGFYIEQSSIQLEDEQKLFLSSKIDSLIEEEVSCYSDSDVKHLAIAVMLELDDQVDLSATGTQLAIESSNAMQMGYIASHFTSTTKAGWARQIIEGMHENKKRASHRLAKNLAMLYRMTLSEALIQLLHEEFGADMDYLHSLKSTDLVTLKKNKLFSTILKPFPEWLQMIH
jgi:hypothetical protein